MKAIVQDKYGSAEVLRFEDIDPPEIGDNDVLVHVRAAGVDRGVWHFMTGLPYAGRIASGLRKPKIPVPGMDLAGIVETVGKNVTRFKPGDEVLGIGKFAFAEYALGSGPLVSGVMCLAIGLWLFYQSHADLGTNWSITLEVREQHRLITQGVYRRIRHPMYLALALYSIGQALVIPNWVAGPSNLIAFVILLALRLRAEERMMVEEFGDEYAAYSAQTKRLIPGVW